MPSYSKLAGGSEVEASPPARDPKSVQSISVSPRQVEALGSATPLPASISPAISVIMTVYNGSRFLEDAVRSVLRQTFVDFEFIIVDDGSTDDSVSILRAFAGVDHRIRVVEQANGGIAVALNRALQEAACDLVAHIDHDDRVLPEWLAEQMAFLERHPECSVVSSYGYFLSTSGARFGFSGNPVDVERGRRELDPSLFVELIHSSVIMRRADVLRVGGYRSLGAEDRDLWGRIVTAGLMIRCNPVPLVEYRLHGASEIARKRTRQQRFARHAVDVNIVRRLRGEAELTPHQVELLHRTKPLLWRLRNSIRIAAGRNFRLAARHFSEGSWMRFICRLLFAFLLRPVYIVSRSRRKMWHKSDRHPVRMIAQDTLPSRADHPAGFSLGGVLGDVQAKSMHESEDCR